MAKRITWKAAMLSAAALTILPGVVMGMARANSDPAGNTDPVPTTADQVSVGKPDPGSKATAQNLIPIKPSTKIASASDFNFYSRPLKNASGLCLTRVGSGFDGAVVLRTCGYYSNQLWDGVAVARDPSSATNYYFQIRNSGYCLQAYNNLQNNGAAVDASPCSYSPLYQMQLWDQSGTATSLAIKTFATATSASTDECLAPSGTAVTQGEPAAHRNCAFSTTATRWSLG